MAYKNVVLLLLGMVCLSVAACKKDPCETVNCLNGGNCVEGSCRCPSNFSGVYCEVPLDPCVILACVHGNCLSNGTSASCACDTGWGGTKCDTLWAHKFYGNYTSSENCGGSTADHAVSIEQGTKFNSITIRGFHGIGTLRLVGDLTTPVAFDVPYQPFSFGIVEGFGSYESNSRRVYMNYSIILGTDTTLCSAVLTRL